MSCLFMEFLLCDHVLKPWMNGTEISSSWKWEEEMVLVAVLVVACSRGKYDSRYHRATGWIRKTWRTVHLYLSEVVCKCHCLPNLRIQGLIQPSCFLLKNNSPVTKSKSVEGMTCVVSLDGQLMNRAPDLSTLKCKGRNEDVTSVSSSGLDNGPDKALTWSEAWRLR